jgi:hypothetical protein
MNVPGMISPYDQRSFGSQTRSMQHSDLTARFGPQPWPHRGLGLADFTQVSANGLGDPYNAYPHSMEMFKGRLYVGTTRANMCMLKVSKVHTTIKYWPVDCPDNLYEIDMRAQIHALDFKTGRWTEISRSPMIEGTDGTQVPRDMGYRIMTIFQGESDNEPTLYCGTYASAKGKGAQILRSTDGEEFRPVPPPEGFGGDIITLRLLVPFKGRLFTSPTGRAGNPNASFKTIVFETRDPATKPWIPVSDTGFGDDGNIGIFELLPFGDHLYAGTVNNEGFQIWRTTAEGNPPYKWECVVEKGAWRGKLNQCVSSLMVFKDCLYVGGGIQHGGVDVVNKIGPAGPELIRIRQDGSWDLVVGAARDTPHGRKEPLSGIGAGFGYFTNGYFWRMGVHDGWIYLGTFNWSLMLNYSRQDGWTPLFRETIKLLGPEEVFENMSGAHLYRSSDGENWLRVTTNGFENPYNYGIRSLKSTPCGLAVGTVNPFAPRVGVADGEGVRYVDNPRGGLEVWLGRTERDRPFPDPSYMG